MDYKGLQLNRGKIVESINNYAEGIQFRVSEISNELHNYSILVPGQNETLLSFYFFKGKTTISVNKNKNSALGLKLADKIIKDCLLIPPVARTIYKKNLSEDDFNEIIRYVVIHDVVISEAENVPHGFKFTLTAADGGTIFLSRYTNNAILIQGESIYLKHLLIEILSDVLPFKEVIDMQLESIASKTTSDQVLEQLNEVIPHAFDFLDETLKTFIAPSIALKAYKIPVQDFAYILYPALRGLEGFIKKMFLEKGIEVGHSFRNFVSYNERTDIASLAHHLRNNFNANERLAIEESYKYYRKNRHGLFHVDGTINTSRSVDTKDEALDVLGEIFGIFENCCKTYLT